MPLCLGKRSIGRDQRTASITKRKVFISILFKENTYKNRFNNDPLYTKLIRILTAQFAGSFRHPAGFFDHFRR